jgi:hypothetical protein
MRPGIVRRIAPFSLAVSASDDDDGNGSVGGSDSGGESGSGSGGGSGGGSGSGIGGGSGGGCGSGSGSGFGSGGGIGRCERAVRFSALFVILTVTLLSVTATFPSARTIGTAWGRYAGAERSSTTALTSSMPLPVGSSCALLHNASSPLFVFFLPLSHIPVPVDVSGLHFVGEVARAATHELALAAKLGRAVTAADVLLYVISRNEALRLMDDGKRAASSTNMGAPLGALDAFDSAELCEGSCLLLELRGQKGDTCNSATLSSSNASESAGAPLAALAELALPHVPLQQSPAAVAVSPSQYPVVLDQRPSPALSNGRACAMRELARHELLPASDAEAVRQAVFLSLPGARRDPMAHFVPIHEARFPHSLQLLAMHADTAAATAAAGEEPWDVFFVFESSIQAESFRSFLSSGSRPDLVGSYGVIVLTAWMQARGNKGPAMVNTKSWAALAVLRPCYDAILYSDAEVQLLRTKGLVQRVREKAAHTTLFATFGCPWTHQTQGSAGLLQRFGKLAALEQLRNISRGFKSWFHFSDAPVFRSNDLLDFFELYNYPTEASALTVYDVAVHNAYGHFRAARREWDLVDLQQIGFPNAIGDDPRKWLWSLEDSRGNLAQGDLRRVAAQYPPGVMWASHIYCERWPAECDERSSIFYVIHMDRFP